MNLRKVQLLSVLLTFLFVAPTIAQKDRDCLFAHFPSLHGLADCGALNHWAYIVRNHIALSLESGISRSDLISIKTEFDLFQRLAESRTLHRGRLALSLFELTGITPKLDDDDMSGAAFEIWLLQLQSRAISQKELDSALRNLQVSKNVLFETIYSDGGLTAIASIIFLEHGAEAAINFMDAIIVEIWELRERGFSSEETVYELDVWLNETLGLDNWLQRSITCFVSAIRSGTNIRSRPSTSSARLGIMTGKYYEAIGKVIGDEGMAWFQLSQGGYVRHDVVSETDACKDLR